MILNRTMKIFIAVATLVAAVLLISGHIINDDPLEDWLLAVILAFISIGTWFWLWQSNLAESRSLVAIDESAALPKPQEWVISSEPDEPVAELPAAAGDMKEADTAEAPAAGAGKMPDVDTKEVVPTVPSTPASGEPDDLTRIEGIGPKYRDALAAAGISTFDQLAAASMEQIEQTAEAAGMRRSASMSTWVEQAKLAAKNDWEGLDKLQTKLTGGRR
jgi:predicted flap endonuclease-1-like 5' DNA nuclease